MASNEGKPHLYLQNTAKTEAYKYPKQVRGSSKLRHPLRNRASHGRKLKHDLATVRSQLAGLASARQAVGIQGDRGVYLEIASDPEFDLALQSLDRRDRTRGGQRHIELVAVREQADTTFATIFVPEGKLQVLENLIQDYLTKETPTTQRSKGGKPRNQVLVESIAAIRSAAVTSFWTDDMEVFPTANQPIWWEVWLRAGSDRELHFADFASLVEQQQMSLQKSRIEFPDRTVCLCYGTIAQMTSSVELLDCVAELRKAKELASLFTEMTAHDQASWSSSMNLTPPGPNAPAVCILDSGITNAHPSLAPAIGATDLHSYNTAWGTGDDARWNGHGTNMAGLALHGDLAVALADPNQRVLEHRLESVKILPPTGFPQNEPKLYGAITQHCTGLPEIAHPNRSRLFAMAVSMSDFRDRGSPSSWSAEIDELAFNGGGTAQRLFLVAAGNVRDPEQWKNYPNSNDVEQIHDPAQAWNALAVGAHTEKVLINTAQYPDWTPVAPMGGLSPSSATSVTWSTIWPRKPDIVLEGGNYARNPGTGDVDPIDDLALLTTHFRPVERLFKPTGDTSAATAQAARLGATLMARYPRFWPETIRGLLVHSAEWTPSMRAQTEHARTPEKQHELLLKRYGWGVPSLERACWSATNVLTLIAQERLRPYGDAVGSAVPTQDMHVYALPWPREQLEELFDTEVRLRVTLSYFIEPNPARRGWKYRHLYASHGLRFEVKRPDESLPAFRARMSKEAQSALDQEPDFTESGWELPKQRGSIHSNWWKGPAADLAERGHVIVFPVTGWWKERPHFERWKRHIRYSLVVSIEVPTTGVDIYTPVANQIATAVAAGSDT